MLLEYQAVPNLQRKRFTVREVDYLLDAGFFVGQRFELIDGDLFDKMGQSPSHAATIHTLMVEFSRVFGVELVLVQMPVEAGGEDRDRSMPEPDVAVLREYKSEFGRRHPRGDELALAVDVSDTSAAFDLTRKAELYANAGVPEYWVVDLPRRLVVRQRDGRAGTYQVVEAFASGSHVPVADRVETLAVDDMLPNAD